LSETDLRQARDVWPELIDGARRTVDINEFYVTPSTGGALEATLQALERAAKRGVRIRVMLEKKFEGISREGIVRLRSMPGLELRIADWSVISGAGIIHAKYFVVDSTRAFVGSQNLDWRSLQHIHEMGLSIDDATVVAQVRSVFEHDWALANSTASAPADNFSRPQPDRSGRAYVVASPWPFNPKGVGDSESELVRLISSAREEIVVQNLEYVPLTYARPPEFYGTIDSALRAAAVRGVKITLLVSAWSTEEPAVKHLQSLAVLPNVTVRVITIPDAAQGPIPFARVAHSKYAVFDGHTLFLGTSNWRGGYFDQSRNLEIVVHDPALAARAAAVQKHLWDSAYAAPLEVLKTYSKPRR
jgi:phosphatidylserine/phosphatidylglycerophosphate/cardiolipin synthase-like enzyme